MSASRELRRPERSEGPVSGSPTPTTAGPSASPQDDSNDFATRLLAWFDGNGRHDLPWQHPRTPYRVWLSEVMLQQTQVRVVIPYFERFLAALPDLHALAAAPTDHVHALWSGLGYYARSRNLHAAAKLCVERHSGELPRDFDELIALPGIGRSTAGAILAQAWGERFAILDGNVKRVLCRVHGIEGWPGTPAIEKRLWALAESQLPDARLADYTQAQMDFGATLCTRADPACVLCPLQRACIALREDRVHALPTPKPGKPLPERHALLLLLRDADGRVLLQRRPQLGVWAGLWSLPEAEDHAAARNWFETHVAGDYDTADALAPIDHGFSHYRLAMQPLAWTPVALRDGVRDNDDLRWTAREELAAFGIPAPVRKLIEGRT